MKKLLLISCGVLSTVGYGQIVNIPDPAFKNFLVNSICANFDLAFTQTTDVDINNDGEIQVSEAEMIQSLWFLGTDFTSIEGMQAFTNLKRLRAGNNNITDYAPIQGLSSLVDLGCGQNPATSIDLSQMVNLESFNGNGSTFTSLDFSQTKMTTFFVNNCTNLTYMNIKNGYMSNCSTGPDDGCTQWFNLTNLIAVCIDEGEFDNISDGYTPLPWGVINSYCSFAPAGDYNTISGSLTFDCSGTPIPLSNISLLATQGAENETFYANGEGDYLYYMSTGPVTLTPQLENPSYFTITPPSFTYDFTSAPNTISSDFCVSANGYHPDLEVSLVPLEDARPGFDVDYKLVYKNKGNQTQSGSVVLNYDDARTDFVGANPVFTSSMFGQLSWDFSNLLPFESREINVTLNVNSPTETPAVSSGDLLSFSAVLTTTEMDETPQNNSFNLNQLVVGSYDPNDKAVSATQITLSQVGDYLHYVVRFQNTGTYFAENVVIVDELAENLDAATMELVSSSHSCHSTISEGNKLEFFFENIDLPAEADNEPGSHGFVAFKIKPSASVGLGDMIENTADIYFDFNFPIVTNTVTTTVTALGLPENAVENAVTIYPNPAGNNVTINVGQNNEVTGISIYNMLGQLIKTYLKNEGEESRVDISALTSGTYLIDIETLNGSFTKRLIKI